jgi:hypothetical protein
MSEGLFNLLDAIRSPLDNADKNFKDITGSQAWQNTGRLAAYASLAAMGGYAAAGAGGAAEGGAEGAGAYTGSTGTGLAALPGEGGSVAADTGLAEPAAAFPWASMGKGLMGQMGDMGGGGGVQRAPQIDTSAYLQQRKIDEQNRIMAQALMMKGQNGTS